MDPNANLAEQREIIKEILGVSYDRLTDGGKQWYVNKSTRLSELAQTLDEWLSKGGFLPVEWEAAYDGTKAEMERQANKGSVCCEGGYPVCSKCTSAI